MGSTQHCFRLSVLYPLLSVYVVTIPPVSMWQPTIKLCCGHRAVIAEYEAAHKQQLPQAGAAATLEQLARETAAAAGTDADRTARAAAGYAFGHRELPPVNAVLGGLLANELLKAISHKGEPVNNWLFYRLSSGVGQIETTRPPPA